MFDIGGLELLIIAVVALLVIGPERLPDALRMLGLGLGRLRRSFTAVKTEIEKEIGMDEVRRQLHNEAVMEEMKRIEREVRSTVDEAKIDPNLAAVKAEQEAGQIQPEAAGQVQPDPANDETPESAPVTPTTSSTADTAPEPAKTPPRSEAEVEAAYERKLRAQAAEREEHN